MATWNMLSTQNSISPMMEQLTFFHDHTMMILIMITMYVGFMMTNLIVNKFVNRIILNNQMIELIWTIIPGVILIFIALPSLHILYLLDEINNPLITIKTMGHQWYWSYEYTDFKNIEFDSYMIPYSEMNMYTFRLLDVDNRMVIPYNFPIRMIVSSSDVIHSWTIPAISVKIDAIPGRLNQTTLFFNQSGLFFGQCSEICGANHSFMPITVESVSPNYFIKWIYKMI